MQPAGGCPDQLGQPCLDIHMDIFERGLELEAAFGNFLFNAIEALENRLAIGLTDDPLAHQHGGVRPAAGDVLGIEAPIDLD